MSTRSTARHITADRWKLIEEIFQTALEHPPSERRAYIVKVCHGDQKLVDELESLIASDGGAATVLHSLVAGGLHELAQSSSVGDVGQQLGPYRLIREIDTGGMGAVFLALRSDDHYFQVVAIKTIRKGSESPSLIQRFRVERQILANLAHPNIGAILDGGDTEDGRPFLVMEYVEGQPITLACHRLSITERLDLFRSACAAVQYAHQNLVIHRDIKPSNVLVTPGGVVKLIDFGIAKALAPDMTPVEYPRTESSQRFMTPDYASPEQLRGEPLTPATDIYSLGVLLFELLTGSRPYMLHGLSPAAAEHLVCNYESPKPSGAPGLSQAIRKELAGDLDRIVAMAMDKDPARRYPSVQHLDDDLLRFRQGRPVTARKATSWYRLSKVIKRHKTASLMACATGLVLGASLLFYNWRLRVADQRVKQVHLLAESAIGGLTEKLQESSASTETQAALLRSAIEYLNQLRTSSGNGNDPRVLLELSKAYLRVGDVEGSPFVANLGRSEAALASYQDGLRAALDARSRMPGDESTQAVNDAYWRLGRLETVAGLLQEARGHYQQSLAVVREFWQQKPADPIRQRLLATNYAGIADVQIASLETGQAVASLRAAFQVFGTDTNGNDDHDRTLMGLSSRMGWAFNELGPQVEAITGFQRAIAVAEELARRSPSRAATRTLFALYHNIVGPLAGRETLNIGDSPHAEIYARKALAIAETLAAGDSKNVQGKYDLASAYAAMGDSIISTRPAIASDWYRKAIALTKEMAPRAEAQRQTAARDEALSDILVTKPQARERLHLAQEATALREELAKSKLPPLDRVRLMRAYCRLSDAELAVNDLEQARQHADAARPFFDEFKVTSPNLLVLSYLGFCFESLGNVSAREATNRSRPSSERRAAAADSRQWLQRSLDTWNEWNRRGVATPASEVERHKVERLLAKRETYEPDPLRLRGPVGGAAKPAGSAK